MGIREVISNCDGMKIKEVVQKADAYKNSIRVKGFIYVRFIQFVCARWEREKFEKYFKISSVDSAASSNFVVIRIYRKDDNTEVSKRRYPEFFAC